MFRLVSMSFFMAETVLLVKLVWSINWGIQDTKNLFKSRFKEKKGATSLGISLLSQVFLKAGKLM